MTTRRQRLRAQALLLGPDFAPIIEAFDAGASAEDLLAAFLLAWDPYGADRFVRLPEVLHLTGLARATLYRMQKDGKFPKAISLDGGAEAEGSVGWEMSAIRKWMRTRPRSSTR